MQNHKHTVQSPQPVSYSTVPMHMLNIYQFNIPLYLRATTATPTLWNWAIRQIHQPWRFNSTCFLWVSLHLLSTKYTDKHYYRRHQSAETRYCSPHVCLPWVGWEPFVTDEPLRQTQGRDLFDVPLTWFLHCWNAVNVQKHDYSSCSRDRKESHIWSIFTHSAHFSFPGIL